MTLTHTSYFQARQLRDLTPLACAAYRAATILRSSVERERYLRATALAMNCSRGMTPAGPVRIVAAAATQRPALSVAQIRRAQAEMDAAITVIPLTTQDLQARWDVSVFRKGESLLLTRQGAS